MKRAVIVPIVMLLASCAESHYRTVEAFRADVETWGLTGQAVDSAKATLEDRGFKCLDDDRCWKDLPGLVCNQRLRVDLSADASQRVHHFSVWSIDGRLPFVCL